MLLFIVLLEGVLYDLITPRFEKERVSPSIIFWSNPPPIRCNIDWAGVPKSILVKISGTAQSACLEMQASYYRTQQEPGK